MNTYTNDEIEYNIEHLRQLCYDHPDNFSRMLIKTQKELLQFVLWYTRNMREREYKMSTLCYWILNRIQDWNNKLVCCRTCGKSLKHKEAKVFRGYIRPHCNVSCSQADPMVYKKIQKNKIERYGSVCNSHKGLQTRLINKYHRFTHNRHVIVLDDFDTFSKKINVKGSTFEMKCMKCGKVFQSTIRQFKIGKHFQIGRCLKCYPNITNRSKAEIDLFNYCYKICTSMGYTIIPNYRGLIKNNDKALECDIYIPDIKLVIEYDGTYWHSEEHYTIIMKQNKNPIRKLFKTMLLEQKGVQCIHIDENDWASNRNKIKRFIRKKIIGTFQFRLRKKIEIIDRQIHNSNDVPDGYQMIKTIEPSIKIIDGKHVQNCGFFVYQRLD